MFLVLLGIATCANICYKKVATTVCPEGATVVDKEQDFAITSTGTIIYTDTTITGATTLTSTNIEKVAEIVSLAASGTLPVTVTLAADSTPTVASLTLSGIALTVDSSATSKLLAAGKLTITSLTMKSGSTLTGTSIVINALTCDSLVSATTATVALVTGPLTLTANDITKVSATAVGEATITDTSGTSLDIPNTVTKANIISVNTKECNFALAGTYTGYTPDKFLVTFVYGNGGKTPITFKPDSTAPTPIDAKIFVVNTYYIIDSGLTTDMQKLFTFNAAFKLTDGKRVSVPKSAAYCLDKLFLRAEGCPEDAEVLWSNDELKSMSNENKMIDLYISGHKADGDILNLDLADYKEKSIKFISANTDQQQIEFKFAADAETVTGNLQFNNIKVTALLKAGSTAGTLGFKSLFIRKSEIIAKNAVTTPAASKNLKTTTIKVTSEDLTSDSDSFKKFFLDVPTRSFSIIDVKSANFKGDGKSVKIDGTTDLTDKNIPTPFKIVLLPGEEPATPIDLTMTKDANGGKAALPFSFDLQKDAKLKVDFTGEWDATNIVVNVADGAKFTGITKTGDANKAPLMKYTGTGTVELDGNPVEKIEPPVGPTPTPKGGLSGGAIAGIVIACVVVVAAVVVVVVIVIKKKKGKVAN